ncbi:hypothetical protein [uncultured Treponema sp.]|uniref:hypothetical protein n=1 Tax=uncultured Treponema sp. TaxID=162155 RepID=UPI0025CEF419|nr:hypothetical protein [uncultured Treponema sp.]
MKKFFISILALAIFSGSAFSKQWTNNIGAGVSFPLSSIGVSETNSKDIFQTGYGIEGTYIGLHENDFTAKANISIGLAASNDLSSKESTECGVFENIALGAGYSFVNTESALFGITGMFGVEMGQYSFADEDDETSLSLVTISFGADIFGIYRFNERIGLFANLNTRWIADGTARSEIETESIINGSKKQVTNSENTDLSGKFILQPTIGVIWSF